MPTMEDRLEALEGRLDDVDILKARLEGQETRLKVLEVIKEDFGDMVAKKLTEIGIEANSQKNDLERLFRDAQAKFMEIEGKLNGIVA